MRVFFAFDVDVAMLDGACAVASAAGATLSGVRWVARELMHVTARFVGDVDEVRVPELCPIVDRVAEGRRAPELHAVELDGYPSARRARVIVLPVLDDGTLAEVATATDGALGELGFAPDERRFTAHLTLGRSKAPCDLRRLRAESVDVRGRAVAFALYASDLSGERPKYTALRRAPLAV